MPDAFRGGLSWTADCVEPENDMSQKKEAPVKQPYVKPEFRFEKVFVTTALSCGKTGSMFQCKTAASAS